jgi:tripartite-type tricarboxylate transporter receptor subunit TctC
VARTGKKFGRQKGGGTARHGDRRAPIFVGGGKAHGPRVRDFNPSLNKKIRALGLSSATRWPTAPEIPTIAEAGIPGFVSGSWAGLLAPGGTPKALVDRLSSEVATIVRVPDVRTRLAELGVEPSGNTPAEFRAFMEAEVARWAKVIDAAKIRLD